MATNNRGGSRSGTVGRGARANKAAERKPDQRREKGVSSTTAAAVVGGAIATGLFLWSRRSELSEQVSRLSNHINEWRGNEPAGGDTGVGDASSSNFSSAGTSRRGTAGRTQAQIAEEALTLKQMGEAAKHPGAAVSSE
jgi:hypothetical protein